MAVHAIVEGEGIRPAASVPLGRLGRYELLHAIASGGMATVYLARAAGIGGFERLVAIKCCHPHLRQDDQFASMFLDEARLAARIHHPNVVSTLDVGEETALYFVMEYVEGVTLAEWVKRGIGGVPAGMALRIMSDVLAGLHAAHELRDAAGRPMELVHRDVSPQNVLVGTDGVSRIVDFGIAKASARATVTRGGEIKGKLGYMPPEQFLGQGVTRQADIYAAGVVLWESLAGRRLFEADSDARVMNLVLQGKVPSLLEIAPSVTPELDAAVRRALARRAEERFPTAAAFAEAIETAGVPMASGREVGRLVESQFSDWLRKRRALIAEVKTRVPGGPPTLGPEPVVQQAPTFLQRILEGRVFIVPRKFVVAGLVALMAGAAATGVLVWGRAGAPPPAPTMSPVASAPQAPPAPVVTSPVAEEPPPPEATKPKPPATKPAKAATKAVTRKVKRPAATPKRAATRTQPKSAKPAGEYRPREL